MNILEKIIVHKKPILKERKKKISILDLEKSIYFNREVISFKKHLTQKNSTGIIAEFKRKSPSKPSINLNANIEKITSGYEQFGASGLSVLTDEYFFGGNKKDISSIRPNINIPILRKDFIFDTYQVFEAKSMGADAILLIAEVLSKNEIETLSKTAKQLGLEILMEIHTEDQLDKLNPYIDLVGVNNRNLKTFEVSLDNSIRIVDNIPNHLIKISESGIKSPKDIKLLKKHGFQGFLIGEQFMKKEHPQAYFLEFVNKLQSIK
jgi:indole-3-glycerol phosphate synthase